MPGRKRKKNAARKRGAGIAAAVKGALKRYAARRRKNPGKLNLNPLRRVMKESGVKKVRVMRSKSGKAVGVKFL